MTEERRRVPIEQAGRSRAPSPAEPDPCDCPRLDRSEWHEVESDWSDIAFARIGMPALFGVPMGFWSHRRRLIARAEKAGTVPEDAMLLMGPGRVRRPVWLEVEDADPSRRDIVTPGGVVFTRLLSAPWGQMRKLMKETRDMARERYGRNPARVWVWYLTCRTCSSERDFETLFVAHYPKRPEPRSEG
ncbi:MAG: hypothetical protein OXG61_01560 [Chloroflexi bacterium]|nr:hypothetical protein [Chloroflexota bacterium]